MAEPTEPVITYAIRELLERIEKSQTQGFADLLAKLDGKADKADVESLRSDLRHLGERTERLEGWRRDEEATAAAARQHSEQVDRSRNWRLGLGGLVMALVVALATVLPVVLR